MAMQSPILAAIEDDQLFRQEMAERMDGSHDKYCGGGNLLDVNHTDAHALVRLPYSELPKRNQLAIHWRKACLARSKWMQAQHGYMDKCALAAACLYGTLNGVKICMCGHHGHLCKEPDYCNKCNLDQRVEPALYEFGDVFRKAPYWLALTPSSSSNPAKAGLRLVTKQHDDGKPKKIKPWIPKFGNHHFPKYGSDWENVELIERLTKIPFLYMQRLKDSGLINGAYATRELDLDFRPVEGPVREHQISVTHTALRFRRMKRRRAVVGAFTTPRNYWGVYEWPPPERERAIWDDDWEEHGDGRHDGFW